MLVIGLEGTQELGEKLASVLKPGDCVALKGDLGAGKTTMTESIVRALHGGDVAVISPTFNLLQTYDIMVQGKPLTLWHYDLYRLESPEELVELALDDALEDGITLIEWPELAEHWLPDEHIEVTIEFAEASQNRDIIIRSDRSNEARLKQADLW